MGLSRLALGLFLLPLNLSEAVACVSDLGICLRPLVDTWEHIRTIESHAGDLIFPLPLYRRNSTLALCEHYETIRRKCFPEDCGGASPMISFVKQQLGYFCGPLLPLYMKKHECSYSVLLRERQCLRHLHGMPNPIVGSVRCNSFVDFFNCIESFLDKKCGHEAVVLFGGAFKSFGCNMDTGAQLEEDLKLLNSSLAYTLDALPGMSFGHMLRNNLEYFEQNRPANYSELITSAEMVSTTAAMGKEKNSMEEVTTKIVEEETTVADRPTTESSEPTTSEDLILARSVTGDGFSPPDQKLNNSLEEGSTTLNDNVRMSEKGNEKAEEESVKDVEITSTVADDQHDLPPTSKKETTLNEVIIVSTHVPEDDLMTNTTEQTAQTEETPVTDAPCSQEDEDYVTACHSLLLRRLAKLSPKDSTSQLRFPLAGVPLKEVQHLCKRYDEGNKCAAEQLNRIESMPREYQCILDTYEQNTKCQKPIQGVLTDEQDPCTGQQDTFDCFTSTFTCSKNTLILLREMIRGYGCRVDLKRWLIQPSTTTIWTTIVPENLTEAIETLPNTADSVEKEQLTKKENKRNKPKKHPEMTTVAPPFLTVVPSTEALSSTASTFTTTERATTQAPWYGTCSPSNRKLARMCMGPLLRTWDALGRRRMPLKKSHFPMYRYTKTELLELCDGYANSFLCAGHDTIRYCLNDELVSFAQGHLGYQCSPQNLRRFLAHYDCIIQVEEGSECKELAEGETLPKKTPTCSSLAIYSKCMAPLVEKQCKKEGAMEFLRSIQQFGCKDVTF